jgi:hypothetical protein
MISYPRGTKKRIEESEDGPNYLNASGGSLQWLKQGKDELAFVK